MKFRVTIEIEINEDSVEVIEGEIVSSRTTGDWYECTEDFFKHQISRDVQHATRNGVKVLDVTKLE